MILLLLRADCGPMFLIPNPDPLVVVRSRMPFNTAVGNGRPKAAFRLGRQMLQCGPSKQPFAVGAKPNRRRTHRSRDESGIRCGCAEVGSRKILVSLRLSVSPMWRWSINFPQTVIETDQLTSMMWTCSRPAGKLSVLAVFYLNSLLREAGACAASIQVGFCILNRKG